MGEVSNGDSIGREMRFTILSGVPEATRSDSHQCNLGDPPLAPSDGMERRQYL